MAFRKGVKEKVRELRVKIKEGKEMYRHKREQKLCQDGVKQVWAGMRQITGMKQKGDLLPDGDQNPADEMNGFFNIFIGPTPPQPSLPRWSVA